MKIHECPWCLEPFAGTDKQAMLDRKEHIADNECGLVPRREREDAQNQKIDEPAWDGS